MSQRNSPLPVSQPDIFPDVDPNESVSQVYNLNAFNDEDRDSIYGAATPTRPDPIATLMKGAPQSKYLYVRDEDTIEEARKLLGTEFWVPSLTHVFG
jgi:hypothetical protein